MPGTQDHSTTEYGTSKGLFGETDRTSGEYRFKSGYTHQVYTNANYSSADDTVPPRYYKPAEQTQPQTEKKKHSSVFAIVLVCLACAITGGAIGAGLTTFYLDNRISTLEENLFPTESDEELIENELRIAETGSMGAVELAADNGPIELSVQEIYEKACSETVSINTEYYYTDRAGYTVPSVVSGSGFIISNDGFIVTNYHVVEKAVEGRFDVAVTLYGGNVFSGSVIGYDKINDIAVLKINAGTLPYATVGDSSSISVGDEIYAVGNPFGILDFTMTTGRISALDRLIATETNENNAACMFQIDAAVFEGNSGGPIYNRFGEVVGIVAAKYSPEVISEGIGFAIPISNVMKIVSTIIGNGYHDSASLGVSFDERYTTMYSNYYGLPAGAYIYSVENGSSAEKAGLMPGDIITQIGQMMIDEYEDVSYVLKNFAPGEQSSIVLYRNGRAAMTWITFD